MHPGVQGCAPAPARQVHSSPRQERAGSALRVGTHRRWAPARSGPEGGRGLPGSEAEVAGSPAKEVSRVKNMGEAPSGRWTRWPASRPSPRSALEAAATSFSVATVRRRRRWPTVAMMANGGQPRSSPTGAPDSAGRAPPPRRRRSGRGHGHPAWRQLQRRHRPQTPMVLLLFSCQRTAPRRRGRRATSVGVSNLQAIISTAHAKSSDSGDFLRAGSRGRPRAAIRGRRGSGLGGGGQRGGRLPRARRLDSRGLHSPVVSSTSSPQTCGRR